MTGSVEDDARLARAWWDMLSPGAVDGLAGLWFGIFTAVEAGRESRCLYVAGTSTFDGDDPDAEWAADNYTWLPDGRYTVLPGLAELAEQPFDRVLSHAIAVVREVAPWRDVPVAGVAVGFDDGDFDVVYQRS